MLFFQRSTLDPGPSNTEVNAVRKETDVAFECYALPSTSRSLPMRSCKKAMVHYDDDLSSSDDDIYNYPEDDADTNFEETEQSNLIESTKNLIENEENVHTNMDENQPKPYYEESDEDSDPYGYRAELLGQHFSSSDDDY